MKDKLRDHIERNLIRRGAQKSAAAFTETLDRLTEAAGEEYDRIVSAGKTDLDAYRGAVEKVAPELNRSAVLLKDAKGQSEEKASDPDKEKDRKNDPEQETISSIESAAHAVLWLVTVAAYFTISFIFNCWNVSWIMFLSAAAGSVIIDMVFALNRGRTILDEWDNLNGVVWLTVTGIYFLVSFLTGQWAFTWLIFIAAIAASVILDTVKKTMIRSRGGNSSQDGGEGSDE
jgi:hypothetical protein